MASPLIAAHMLGISSSVFMSGFSFAASWYAIPAISIAPLSMRLQQFRSIFELGKMVMPPLAMTAFVSWGYLAYTAYYSTLRSSHLLAPWQSYAIAGALSIAVLPYTVSVMLPGINTLLSAASSGAPGSVANGAILEQLIISWSDQNWLRALIPLVGAVTALYGLLGRQFA